MIEPYESTTVAEALADAIDRLGQSACPDPLGDAKTLVANLIGAGADDLAVRGSQVIPGNDAHRLADLDNMD